MLVGLVVKRRGMSTGSLQNPRHESALTCFCAIAIGEAVVLCCAVKDQISGNWRVQETGVRSDGNAKLAW